MKNKLVLFVLTVSFFASACAKREIQETPATETTSDENNQAVYTETERRITFIQGFQGDYEDLPWSYTIDPGKNQVEMIDHEEGITYGFDGEVYQTELLSFSESDAEVKFSYLDAEGEVIEKTFEILSDRIVKDENNRRYEK